MRVRVPSAKGDARALQEIRHALSSIPGVSEVRVNQALGTVTVHYDHSRHDELQEHLVSEASSQKITLAKCPKISDLSRVDVMFEKEVAFLSAHSHAAKTVLEFLGRFDREVRRATGNAIDLQVVAPLALAVCAFVELGVAVATPVWLTLGLFSFNHFVDLHAHPATGDSPRSQG